MGMFANHAQVVHPTGKDDLGDCTACGNTGWVSYPICVGVDENDHDECPNGCEPMSENRRRDYLIPRQPIPMGTIPKELHGAYYASLKDENFADPLITVQASVKARGLVGWRYKSRPRPRGRITTDVPVMGLVEAPGHRVYLATIPPYLVGDAMEVTPLVVSYEYIGSRVNVRYAEAEAGFFRFAYGYEEGYSTSELLS